MNNTKSKNIMKSSFLIIVLGMSMAERVCGMVKSEEKLKNVTTGLKVENAEEYTKDPKNKESGLLMGKEVICDLNDDDVDKILDTKDGRLFVDFLTKSNNLIVYKRTLFIVLCCFGKTRNLMVKIKQNDPRNILNDPGMELGTILKKFFYWEDDVLVFKKDCCFYVGQSFCDFLFSLRDCEIKKNDGSIVFYKDFLLRDLYFKKKVQ